MSCLYLNGFLSSLQVGLVLFGGKCFLNIFIIKFSNMAGCQWLMPIILATQEAEIRRIKARTQPGQIVCETLSQKNHDKKKGWWSGSRCRPSSNPSTAKKKKKFKRKKI
jgi:hypothetical protein